MLTIGIDASRAYVPHPTGTETYAERVIRSLADLTPHRLRLYLRQDPVGEVPASAEVRVIPARRLWTHTRLAMEVLRRPPDALFVPAHVLPITTFLPTIVTIHDLGHRAYPGAHTLAQRAYLEWATRRHARRATRLVVDSESTRTDLAAAFPQCAARIRVAPLGVDEDMRPATPDMVASARLSAGLPPGRGYVLYVGTLQPRKNLTRLVRAWATVCPRWPDVDLVLAGRRGWGREEPLALAARSGIADRVRAVGYVSRRDLPALYTGALALAHPSLYEGFGLTVAEAMACGTPVVVSRASSLPEVVGEAGLLFDPLDEGEIGDCLARVLEDACLRARLSTAGRAQAARFTWERCARAIAAAIEEAAARP